MSTKTFDFKLTNREIFILGQALELAKNELQKVNSFFREDSNIQDMEDLQNKFPFRGIENEYNHKVIIDLKDNVQIEEFLKVIERNNINCKVHSVKTY